MKKVILMGIWMSSLFVNAQKYIGSVVLSSLGNVPITLDVNIDTAASEVKFTFSGPSNKYYAVGFDALSMFDRPYLFITQQTTVQERKMTGSRTAGTLLTPKLVIDSDTTENDVRTLVFRRDLTITGDTDYFDFSGIDETTTLNLIWAEGSSLNIQQHARRGDTSMTFALDNLSTDPIRSQSDSSYIQLSPNPVKTILTIANHWKLKTVAVYDITHKKIAAYDAQTSEGKIDLSALDTGTYVIKSTGIDGSSVSEFIVKE